MMTGIKLEWRELVEADEARYEIDCLSTNIAEPGSEELGKCSDVTFNMCR